MKCHYCNKDASYKIDVAQFNKRSIHQKIGTLCNDHVIKGINEIGSQCFGTILWPVISDLKGRLLYHSYDADRKGFSMAAGWDNYLQDNKPV